MAKVFRLYFHLHLAQAMFMCVCVWFHSWLRSANFRAFCTFPWQRAT